MAGNSEILRIIAEMSVRGAQAMSAALRNTAADLEKVNNASTKSAVSGQNLGRQFVALAGTIGAAGFAAKQLYDTLRQGAVLQTTQQRFEKLSASIGSTSDAMMGSLRAATQGMISDMDLMSSASQIMSLKLADNQEQVTRLATVAGTLGWDMQQVILTFANLSTMRLDALGLSVEEVKSKAAELEAQGMSATAAFKEAVILAGEARLDIGGVSESEQAFKQLEAAIANTRNELSLVAIELANNIGLIDAMSESASKMQVVKAYREMLEVAQQAGVISPFQEAMRTADIAGQDINEVKESMRLLNLEMRDGDNAALVFQYGIVSAMSNARMEIIDTISHVAALTAAFRAAVMPGQLDWMGGAIGGFHEFTPAPPQAKTNRYAGWVAETNARNRANEEERASLQATEAAMYSLGGAVSSLTQAEMALTAAHASLASAFMAEITGKAEDGLIDAAGIVNIEAANKALFSQAQAAGATAGQLAILGVATGQFTEEEAKAALKAAILGEKIKQLAAAAIATGDVSGAVSGLDAFRQQLDAGQIAGAATSVEDLAGAAEALATGGPYTAELSLEDAAMRAALADAQMALDNISGTYHINIVTTQTTVSPGVTTTPVPAGTPPRPAGPTAAPEIQVNNGPGGRSALISGRSGGSQYNVTVTNYIDGRMTPAQAGDVTADKIKQALDSLGVRGGR